MNKWQTQDEFWNSFGIPAYDEQTKFKEGDLPSYPHITYQSFGGHFGQRATLSASLWYRSASLAEIKKKADEIEAYIGGGLTIQTDDAMMWIMVPEMSAFAQPAPSGNDDIKRIVLTIEAENLSAI